MSLVEHSDGVRTYRYDGDAEGVARNEKGQLVKGSKGISPGRKVGSRNKLGEAFIADLYSAWETHGSAVIDRVISEKPDVFLKVIANTLPKDINLKVQALDDLSDEQLMRKLAVLQEMAKPLLAKLNAVDVPFTEVSSPVESVSLSASTQEPSKP